MAKMAQRRAVEEIAVVGFMMVVVAAIENPIRGTQGIEAQIVVGGSAIVARPPVVEKAQMRERERSEKEEDVIYGFSNVNDIW